MIAQDVMSRDAKCLAETDTVQQAALLMRDENVGFVPICSDGRVVGTVTDRDIVVRLIAEGGLLSAPLSSLMTRDPVVCKAADDLAQIEKTMEEQCKSRIVCVDDERRPVGIISLSDIAQCEDESRAGAMLRTITKRETRASQQAPANIG